MYHKQILSREGETQVGEISKQWSGFFREALTDADNFVINFPMDMDVKMKAVLVGACFLIVRKLLRKSTKSDINYDLFSPYNCNLFGFRTSCILRQIQKVYGLCYA